ncbi:MAG: hypothetical protein HPY54_14710 [Chthonomonadetes bacterium]|nr:hypothetical protein [Chthonomonadetes bacterium]
MKQHVFAFAVALVVWVMGNLAIGGLPVFARTGGVAMGCVTRTDVYRTFQCGGYPACPGFCSEFQYDTARCDEFSGLYCTEHDAAVPYRHYQTSCSPSWGYGCICNWSSKWLVSSGYWYPYPQCP